MVSALKPSPPRLHRITSLPNGLFLIEHTGGRTLLREVSEERGFREWRSLERPHPWEEVEHEAHDELDGDLRDVASDIICDGRRVPGCEVVQ
jgi:hypothetical protein